MRLPAPILGGILLLPLLAAIASPSALAEEWLIAIHDIGYSQHRFVVTIGDKLTFQNRDKGLHTVTAEDGSFDSGDIGAGQSYVFHALQVRDVRFFDRYNPSEKGIIRVRPAENHPPVLRVTSPRPAEEVFGFVPVRGTGEDADGDAFQVHVRLDGRAWERADGSTEWETFLDVRKLEEGPHWLEISARDERGAYAAVQAVPIRVNNSLAETLRPRAAIESPAGGTEVSGVVMISGVADDPRGQDPRVRVRVDGGSWKFVEGASRWRISWDTSVVRPGNHTIEVQALGKAGPSNIHWIRVHVLPQGGKDAVRVTTPTMTLLSPVPGALATGTLEVEGVASDPAGRTLRVEYRVARGPWQLARIEPPPSDGAQEGSTSGPIPWRFLLDTTSMENGNVTIQLLARAGNETSRTLDLPIEVRNAEPTLPTLAIETPSRGARLTGTLNIQGRAANFTVSPGSAVQVRIDEGDWAVVNVTNGAWGLKVDTRRYPDGLHRIEARAVVGRHETEPISTTVVFANTRLVGEPLRSDAGLPSPGGDSFAKAQIEANRNALPAGGLLGAILGLAMGARVAARGGRRGGARGG